MTKINWKLGIAVAAVAATGFACGNDNKPGTNNGTNNGSNNGPTNNGTGNNTTGNNTTGNNTTNTNNNTAGTNNNTVVIEPPPPGCDDTPRPPRCDLDPTAFTWGPASVVDTFFIEGTENEPICCFDYDSHQADGDEDIDNSLGNNLAAFGFLDTINTSIAENLASGSLALVLEHDGLDALDNDDDFTVNFFIGEHDVADFATTGFQPSANPVVINPQSFDEGAQPQAYLPDASVTAGAVVAGPGSVKIQIVLFDSPLNLTISRARIETDVDAANSALDDTTGVSLTSGKLGGVVKVSDIFAAVNEFAEASCACLGLMGEPLVNVETGGCSDNADKTQCDTDGNTTCSEVAGACGLFSAVALFSDVDTDGDGLSDAVSIGAAVTAAGADINGIAP